MNAVRDLVANGGPAFVAIMVLSVLLYERCFHLLLLLRRNRRETTRKTSGPPAQLPVGLQRQQELQEAFRQQSIAIVAMIAAAPLLGLLGTVMGMIAAFDSLALHGTNQSMEGLAQGISEVLIDTESGLAVAIPAVLLLFFARHQMDKGTQELTESDAPVAEAR